MNIALITLAFLIVVTLTAYATILLLRLRKQSTQRLLQQEKLAAATQAKIDDLSDNIRYIATAMIEERCEVSEGVVRIAKLFEILSMTERVSPEYPSLFKHFDRIKVHPIKEARKTLSKKERMKLDYERMRSESELENEILNDAKKLMNFSPSALQ